MYGQNIGSALVALANADAVCFDVDSTVIQEEGIVSYAKMTYLQNLESMKVLYSTTTLIVFLFSICYIY